MSSQSMMFVWSPRATSFIYHHCTDVILTPRGRRFLTACGEHLDQVKVAIGTRSIPDNERRRRHVCRGCVKTMDRGKK